MRIHGGRQCGTRGLGMFIDFSCMSSSIHPYRSLVCGPLKGAFVDFVQIKSALQLRSLTQGFSLMRPWTCLEWLSPCSYVKQL